MWAGWSDGAAGSPTFQYGSSWGRIKLETTEVGHSDVIDTGNTKSKTITISTDRYGVGVGIGAIYIRGQATSFAQDAVSPSWEEYTSAVVKTWRWIQIKLVGPVG